MIGYLLFISFYITAISAIADFTAAYDDFKNSVTVPEKEHEQLKKKNRGFRKKSRQ